MNSVNSIIRRRSPSTLRHRLVALLRLGLVVIALIATSRFASGIVQSDDRRLVNGKAIEIEVLPDVIRKGSTWRFRYRTTSHGRLRIAARGDGIDPKLLVVVGASGRHREPRRLEDDDSGGGSDAYVEVPDVGRNVDVTVEVRIERPIAPTIERDAEEPDESETSRRSPRPSGALKLSLVLHQLEHDPTLGPFIQGHLNRLGRAEGLRRQGQLAEARGLLEKIITECENRGVTDDVEVVELLVRQAAMVAYRAQGPRIALRGHRIVLEQRLRTLPPLHPELQTTREDVGICLAILRRTKEADELFRVVLENRERIFSDDHSAVISARSNRAGTLFHLGHWPESLALRRQVLTALERTRHPDDAEVQKARGNLATNLAQTNRFDEAAKLGLCVLEVYERKFPNGHPRLDQARGNAAIYLAQMGRTVEAVVLQRQALRSSERNLPPDHPRLWAIRASLAGNLRNLGQQREALELMRRVVDFHERTMPKGDLWTQKALHGLATILSDVPGETEKEAAEIYRRVIATCDRSGTTHERIGFEARSHLAFVLYHLGKKKEALDLLDEAIALMAERVDRADPLLLMARRSRGIFLADADRFDEAFTVVRQVLEVASEAYPENHKVVQGVRVYLVWMALLAGRNADARRAAPALLSTIRTSIRDLKDSMSERAVANFVTSRRPEMAFYFSATASPDSTANAHAVQLAAVEEWSNLRTHALRFERLRTTADEPTRVAVAALRTVEENLERALREGRVKEASRLAARRDECRIALRKTRRQGAVQISSEDFDVDAVATALDTNEIAVRFFTYNTVSKGSGPIAKEDPARLLALILKRDGSVLRLELGSLPPIRDAVATYREAVRDEGRARNRIARSAASKRRIAAEKVLRDRLIKPIAGAVPQAVRWNLALDGALHGLPWEALPVAITDSDTRLGDVVDVRYRTTLREIATPPPAATSPVGRLVAFGGLDFDHAEQDRAEGDDATEPAIRRPVSFEALASERGRGRKFESLAASGIEVDAIARLYGQAFGESAPLDVVTGREGTRTRLENAAGWARHLHLATHAYYLPETFGATTNKTRRLDSVVHRARTDLQGLGDPRGLAVGIMPHALCGIAFAGSNIEVEREGQGLFDRRYTMSGSEIARLDLSGCDLVVLSACEGNVGVTRTGDGIASLQEAFQIAGARSVISALWPVPDEVTKDLMIAFYEELWLKKKTKAEALRAAKRKFRDSKDSKGRPKYVVRDWAGWVLTGEPK